METTLSILDYKNIIQTVKEVYGVDLSQHAMGSLNRNISYLMKSTHHYSSPTLVINALKENKAFFEKLLSCIYCEHVSLFRDPAMWRILKTKVLDKILEKSPLKIWIPEVSRGSDYYSLLIYLHQHQLLKKSKIIISSQSHTNLDKCRIGAINSKLILNSESNFKRLNESYKLEDFVEKKGLKYFIKKEFLTNTYIYKNSIEDINMPYQPNLVLFRNRMIYYTHVKEQKVINILHSNIVGGGFLINGVNENIAMFDIDKKFRLYDQEEQIYRRHF